MKIKVNLTSTSRSLYTSHTLCLLIFSHSSPSTQTPTSLNLERDKKMNFRYQRGVLHTSYLLMYYSVKFVPFYVPCSIKLHLSFYKLRQKSNMVIQHFPLNTPPIPHPTHPPTCSLGGRKRVGLTPRPRENFISYFKYVCQKPEVLHCVEREDGWVDKNINGMDALIFVLSTGRLVDWSIALLSKWVSEWVDEWVSVWVSEWVS